MPKSEKTQSLASKNSHSVPPKVGRRVLLVVTGLTPQVLTETVWALVKREAPWVPTAIHVVTTAHGKRLAEQALLGRDGAWNALANALKSNGVSAEAFTAENIHIAAVDGVSLDDITDERSNTSMADLIVRHVADWSAQTDVELHVSMAGGRKTMSYFAGQAMNLLGRTQDRLSHVLLSWPDAAVKWTRGKPQGQWSIEVPEFFFPGQVPRLKGNTVDHKHDVEVTTALACIQLSDVPFLRLCGSLPPPLREKVRDGFAPLVNSVNRAMFDPPVMTFNVANKTVDCNGIVIPLTEVNFAMLLLIARRGSAGLAHVPANGDVVAYLETVVEVALGIASVQWNNLSVDALSPVEKVISGLATKAPFAAPVSKIGKRPGAISAGSPMLPYTDRFTFIGSSGRNMTKSNLLYPYLLTAFTRFAPAKHDDADEYADPPVAARRGRGVWRLPQDVQVSIKKAGE